MQPRGHALRLSPPRRPRARGGQAEEVVLLDVVQVQNPRERFQDLPRGVLVAAALQPQVVVGADAREHGDFLPAEPGNAAVRARRDPGLLRSDQRPPGAEVTAKRADAVIVTHNQQRSSGPIRLRGPCRDPGTRGYCLRPGNRPKLKVWTSPAAPSSSPAPPRESAWSWPAASPRPAAPSSPAAGEPT